MEQTIIEQSPIPTKETPPITSYSKNNILRIVGIVLVIIFVGGVFYYLGMKHGQSNTHQQVQQMLKIAKITPTNTPTLSPTNSQQNTTQISDANTVVQNYYNWYVWCQQNHFANTSTKNSPQQDCPFNAKGILSTELVNKLQQAQDYDPVLCVQNTVAYVTFGNPVIETSNMITVNIYQEPYHQQGQTAGISVGVQKMQNMWKIASITCNH